MKSALELVVVGEAPANIDLSGLHRVVGVLGELSPAWLVTGHINLKLVDDQSIRALNNKYSSIDSATDVLSFSYIEEGVAPIEGELGDIVISLETAERQAEAAGTTLDDELALLGLHGIMHVLGWDHATTVDQAKLETQQRDILAAANVTYRDFAWKPSD